MPDPDNGQDMAAGIRYGNRPIVSTRISVGVEAGNQVSRTYKVRPTCLRPMPVTRLTPFVAARITISGGVAALTPGYPKAPLPGCWVRADGVAGQTHRATRRNAYVRYVSGGVASLTPGYPQAPLPGCWVRAGGVAGQTHRAIRRNA